jgi:hypothetical protein
MRTLNQLDAAYMAATGPWDDAGSTCVAVVARPDPSDADMMKVHVINVGDSRCMVLTDKGSISFVTQDHKPDLPLEKVFIADFDVADFCHYYLYFYKTLDVCYHQHDTLLMADCLFCFLVSCQ